MHGRVWHSAWPPAAGGCGRWSRPERSAAAERLFGDPDYLLRVATADLDAYQSLRDERLATLPGVQRLTSTIVMKRIVEERPFPV